MKAVLHCTDRQGQILDLAARGQSDKEIAVSLGVSIHTVRTHLQRLYRTAGLSNRAEAVASWLAQRAGEQAEGPVATEEELAVQEQRVAEAAALSVAAELPNQTSVATAQADLVNQERLRAGLSPLDWDDRLASIAGESAHRMAEQGHLATILGSLQPQNGHRVQAENVGYWSGVNDAQLHALFVADPKQRANVLGDFRSLGAAWAITPAGVAFLSVVFA